jgi:hypothetical protein
VDTSLVKLGARVESVDAVVGCPPIYFSCSLVRALNCLVPLLFRQVCAISECSGSVHEGVKVASHRPSVDLMHVILRPTSRTGWLSRVDCIHLERAVMIGRRSSVGIVVVGWSALTRMTGDCACLSLPVRRHSKPVSWLLQQIHLGPLSQGKGLARWEANRSGW